MNILIACEYSGIVRSAFESKGHFVVSCDLLESEKPGRNHYQGDVRNILNSKLWDLVIAHPPCTYISNCGSRWFSTDTSRQKKLIEAVDFFKLFLDLECPFVIENPIPSSKAVSLIGKKYTQLIQPYQFGHPYSKATCLWLSRGLPLLKPTHSKPEKIQVYTNVCGGGKDRAKIRARTFSGIATALADTYG